MKRPLITLTSDFGVQTQGIGLMKGVVLGICPDANVINLMHGIPNFDLRIGARTMETVSYLPIGFHVCVVDPGVGTKRKAIIIETNRGDFLIGPDNGVLIPATLFLEGIKKVIEITNEKYMRKPVSPIFHGRDVFAPATAHLANGVSIEEFGSEIKIEDLCKPPYNNANMKDNHIEAEVISVNKFGSLHLNITYEQIDSFNLGKGNKVELEFNNKIIKITYVNTFGDVEKGKEIIMKDDYGRVEVAINQGNFIKKYAIKVGDNMIIKKL